VVEENRAYRRATDSNLLRVMVLAISFMLGMISSGSVAWMSYVRTAVTLPETDQQIQLQDRDIQTEIDALTKAVDRNTQSITWLIENPGVPKR
jgi:uncharacterized membrane protein YciS (DUF1049 family)